jgi:hypothetical protein
MTCTTCHVRTLKGDTDLYCRTTQKGLAQRITKENMSNDIREEERRARKKEEVAFNFFHFIQIVSIYPISIIVMRRERKWLRSQAIISDCTSN